MAVVTEPATLHFGPYWARWAVRETQSDISASHINFKHLYDCPNSILKIALVANKYAILFILKVLEGNDWGSIALR